MEVLLSGRAKISGIVKNDKFEGWDKNYIHQKLALRFELVYYTDIQGSKYPVYVSFHTFSSHPAVMDTWQKAGGKVRRGKKLAPLASQYRGSGKYLSNMIPSDACFEYEPLLYIVCINIACNLEVHWISKKFETSQSQWTKKWKNETEKRCYLVHDSGFSSGKTQ